MTMGTTLQAFQRSRAETLREQIATERLDGRPLKVA
jgi:hypothetical protein